MTDEQTDIGSVQDQPEVGEQSQQGRSRTASHFLFED